MLHMPSGPSTISHRLDLVSRRLLLTCSDSIDLAEQLIHSLQRDALSLWQDENYRDLVIISISSDN